MRRPRTSRKNIERERNEVNSLREGCTSETKKAISCESGDGPKPHLRIYTVIRKRGLFSAAARRDPGRAAVRVLFTTTRTLQCETL